MIRDDDRIQSDIGGVFQDEVDRLAPVVGALRVNVQIDLEGNIHSGY